MTAAISALNTVALTTSGFDLERALNRVPCWMGLGLVLFFLFEVFRILIDILRKE